MKTRDVVYIGVCTALLAVCSWISIPSVVPFTLQTLGVFLTVLLLGGKRGTIAVVCYIVLGAVGLPVFAGFQGGFSCLVGTTGGYILGFIVSALIMWIFEKLFRGKTWAQLVSMAVGLIACYAVGTVWFMYIYAHTSEPVGVLTILAWCVFPFIIPDVIKLALAFVLARRLRRFVPEE